MRDRGFVSQCRPWNENEQKILEPVLRDFGQGGLIFLVHDEVYDCENNRENHDDYPHKLQYCPHGTENCTPRL
jgi:hypothetical protein